jgi:hypothetical protein
MSAINLLRETVDFLGHMGKSPSDVRWIGSWHGNIEAVGSWGDFAALADLYYDDGYGSAEVMPSLKIVGDDWWLERGEYDGSEWWEFKTLPAKPANPSQLRADDLKERP